MEKVGHICQKHPSSSKRCCWHLFPRSRIASLLPRSGWLAWCQFLALRSSPLSFGVPFEPTEPPETPPGGETNSEPRPPPIPVKWHDIRHEARQLDAGRLRVAVVHRHDLVAKKHRRRRPKKKESMCSWVQRVWGRRATPKNGYQPHVLSTVSKLGALKFLLT